jgi:hypothetical protein
MMRRRSMIKRKMRRRRRSAFYTENDTVYKAHIQTARSTSKLASTTHTNYQTPSRIHIELNNPIHQGGCTTIQFGPATSFIS